MFRKTYKYSLPELLIHSEYINVYPSFCSTIDDLKKKIATDLHIPNECLQFKNPPNTELKNIDDFFEFKLELSVPHDITIYDPKNNSISIKDCYKMKFEEIFPFFREKGIYYSEKCIKYNILLYSTTQEISREGYPFISKNTYFKLKFKKEPIELKCGENKFIFSEFDQLTDAKNLIAKCFPYCDIKIQDTNKSFHSYLSSNNKYIVKISRFFNFINIESYNKRCISVDLMEAVSAIQKELADIYNQRIKPEDVIIFDYKRNPISETNKPLIDFIKLDKDIYYHLIDKKDDKKFKKKIFISIPDIMIEKEIICVDINVYKTVNDLKKLIAPKYNISEDQLNFETSKEELKYYEDYFNFKLKISSLNPDHDVLLPNGEKIIIKDCYKKNFDEIIKSLEKERYYFSQECISNNFHLYLSDKEISHEGYQLLSINKKSKLEIKLIGKFIELKYDKFHFFLSENEYLFEAKDLIKKCFPLYDISIQDSIDKNNYQLVSNRKYNIKVEIKVTFINIESNYQRSILVDYLDTISSVKKKLANESYYYYEKLNAENIIIYDKDKKKLEDDDKPMSSYLNLQQEFYYSNRKNDISDYPTEKDKLKYDNPPLKIDKASEESKKYSDEKAPKDEIKIIIICSKNNKKQFYPIRENISLDSTIGDIEKIVSNKNDIKDKIIIKYEAKDSMEPIESTKKIKEIKDLIRVEKPSGKIDYLLYYEIQSEAADKEMKDKAKDKDEKRYKSDEPSKTVTDDTTSDDDESSKKPLTINKEKENWSPKTKESPDNKKELIKAKKEIAATTYDEEDHEGGNKAIESKKRPNKSKFKPKIIPTTPESSPKKEERASTLSTYNFKFKSNKKQIKMRDDSTIEMQIPTIKKEFNIPSEAVIKLEFNGNDDDSNPIENIKSKMSKFKNGTIQISLSNKPKIKAKEDKASSESSESPPKLSIKVPPNSDVIKYIIQVGDDDPEVIKLKKDATVKTMKEKIAEERGIEDPMCIKILFAGKELLNDILLEPMKIGDITLFVFIPTTEEIFLQTAKALQVPRNKDYDDDYDDD